MATIVGRLRVGEFSPAALRCRIDTYAGSVLCEFSSDIRDVVLDAMGSMVMAEGMAELHPNGASVRLLHLSRLEQLHEANNQSLDSLANQQGIQPLRSLDELRGPDIENFEEFAKSLRSIRCGD